MLQIRRTMAAILRGVFRRLYLFIISPRSAVFMLSGILYNSLNYLMKLVSRSSKVKCNICGWEGYRFSAIVGANYVRFNAFCPACLSAERNRALIEYLNKTRILAKKRLKCLDIAPVGSYRTYLESKGWDYISIDLYNPAMMKMDATRLAFSDDKFDLIICSHVLEHIKKDIEAIKEMFRVLKDDGACYVMVPLNKNRVVTLEYERQNSLDPGHVRAYGLDFMDRIKSAGFRVEEIDLLLELNKNDVSRYGLGTEQGCFLCKKVSSQSENSRRGGVFLRPAENKI